MTHTKKSASALQKTILLTCDEGRFSCRVVKCQRPEMYQNYGQRARIESAPLDDKGAAECGMLFMARHLWERRFQTDLARISEKRAFYKSRADMNTDTEGCAMSLDLLPRRSLFGRKVNPFLVENKSMRVINPKWLRCPEQYLFFHRDIAHFLFPDLKNWAGKVVLLDRPGECSRYRLDAVCAAMPVYPELGTVATIWPSGIRGLLFRVIWNLLRIEP